jgi:ribosomal protein S18 acetylase RimI-like enzyme
MRRSSEVQIQARFAEPGDTQRLVELDPWPSDCVRTRKVETREIIVAEAADAIIGTLRFEFIWTTVPFISFIRVDEVHRGVGASRRMLELLISELKQKGYPALLSSAQTDEPSAQQWHEHLGFRRNGLIENIADEGVGEIVYRLLL